MMKFISLKLELEEALGADADDLVQEVLMVVSQELQGFNYNERTGGFPQLAAKDPCPSIAEPLVR